MITFFIENANKKSRFGQENSIKPQFSLIVPVRMQVSPYFTELSETLELITVLGLHYSGFARHKNQETESAALAVY